jgi:putative ATP-dependent endonuclease of OLD family
VRICELRIDNFRGIKSGHVRFGRHSVLVGANNAGKTTVIEAMVLMFGRDRLVRTLTEHDFYGGCPDRADRIRIVATITGFEPDTASEHRDWFMDGRAVEKWYDANTGMLHAEKTAAHESLALQIGFCARFDHETLEVETIRYFHDSDAKGDPFDDDPAPSIPRSLIQELGFFLVPANRTWDAVISFGSGGDSGTRPAPCPGRPPRSR